MENRRPAVGAVSAESVRRCDLAVHVLRRLDCILEPTKDEVLAEYKKISATKVDPAVMPKAKFKLPFYQASKSSGSQASFE